MHRQSTPPRPSSTSAAVGLGVRAMQVAGRHQHPRRAGAALGAAAGEERGLERRRAVGPGETLDRLDAPAVDLARGDEAGADLLAVEPHRARAAVAGIAADLGAGQAEVLAQDVHEAASPVRAHLDASPVDLEPEGRVGDHAATPVITPRPRRPRAGPASAPRPSGSRRTRGRRRSAPAGTGAPSPARSRGPARPAARGARARGRAAAGRPASRPRPRSARRRRRPRSTTRTADTATIEITRYAREPSFRNVDRATPVDPASADPAAIRDLRHPQARDELAGPQVGPPVAEHEVRDRDDARAIGRRDLDRGVQRQQVGQPVGRRRGVHDVPAHGARVLDLPPADRPGRRPQPVELGRERRLGQVGPRGQRRDPPRVAVVGHAPQPRERRDVEDRSVDRARWRRRGRRPSRPRRPAAAPTPGSRAPRPAGPGGGTAGARW